MFHFDYEVDLQGYVLIIPSVSIGNVPQLAADLTVSSLHCKKVASIWHSAIVSSVGSNPFETDSSDVCTSCELFTEESLKLAVLQFRSTLNKKYAVQFFIDLKEEIRKLQIKSVIILCSAFDYELHTICEEKFFVITNHLSELSSSIRQMPKDPVCGTYVVPGGGYSVRLFEVLSSLLPCTVLIQYVSEGDNKADAVTILDRLCNFFEPFHSSNLRMFTYPSSWNRLFGSPPPVEMF